MRGLRKLLDPSGAAGFSLIEVLISLMLTMVVMAAVYALLLRGQVTFQREPQVVDLQQNARSALKTVTDDILQAGSGLPPEFPAFTLGGSQDSGSPGAPDTIELIGSIQGPDQAAPQTQTVTIFVPGPPAQATLADPDTDLSGPTTNNPRGDLVIIYDNKDVNGGWWIGRVTTVTRGGPNAVVDVAPEPPPGDARVQSYVGTRPPPASGFITRISVVRYSTQVETPSAFSPPPNVLLREVDFGNSQPVAYVDNFQVSYIFGDGSERNVPADPQPAVGVAATCGGIITSVRVQVKARSLGREDEMGSATPDTAQGEVGNFIRKTFSSIVSVRNIINALGVRTATNDPAGVGPCYQ